MKQIFEAIWNATPWQLVSWIGSIVLGVSIVYVVIALLLTWVIQRHGLTKKLTTIHNCSEHWLAHTCH
ncbi:prophage P2a protein 28 [Lactiplantibacillus plantarum]|nr:prophage P2a protein 28 [Lactiplantibacillus plantarum]MCG0864511.1 prophage P2a protein 28 [Lactiplantibacillus plantarum]